MEDEMVSSAKDNLESYEVLVDLAIGLASVSAKLASAIREAERSLDGELPSEKATEISKVAQQAESIMDELSGQIGLVICHRESTGGTKDQEEDLTSLDSAKVPYCEVCDNPIQLGRTKAIPGVRICVVCAEEIETAKPAPAIFLDDADISRYRKRRARELADAERKARALRAMRKGTKRKGGKKKRRKKPNKTAK
jgi:RNA polymerase-binding transcription factor DksA